MASKKTALDWEKLLSEKRRKPKKPKASTIGKRTEIERDFDRILFSTPVRRLADKTQVWPLEKHDSVRTRLTHSHEVANLARSLGTVIAHDNRCPKELKSVKDVERNLPSILATVGLAHDIGNPPFGHQGEEAIQDWFKKNKEIWEPPFEKLPLKFQGNKDQMKQDFLQFEGNAQALRILTKLQVLNDTFGLNLTVATLGALMKYPTTSNETDDSNAATKKFGVYFSEMEAAEQIWLETGLKQGVRHPLAFIMEACDDIAYSVLDAEDAIKKGVVSFNDLIERLKRVQPEDKIIAAVVERALEEHSEHKKQGLSQSELNDISAQMFQVYAIHALVTATQEAFFDHIDAIMAGTLKEPLLKVSSGKLLCKELKDFALDHAYKHRSVLELELGGHNTIRSIMDMLWPAIEARGDPKTSERHPGNVFERYAYSRISENYRRIFEDISDNLPLCYKRCQLLADMVSGMTDSFAVQFERELRQLKDGMIDSEF